MPFADRASKRWVYAVGALVILAAASIFLAGWNVTITHGLSDQEKKVAVLSADLQIARAKLDAAEKLRVGEAKAAKLRAQAECRGSIATTALGNKILETVRNGWLAQARDAINPDFRDALLKSVSDLPFFPTPKCDAGRKGNP